MVLAKSPIKSLSVSLQQGNVVINLALLLFRLQFLLTSAENNSEDLLSECDGERLLVELSIPLNEDFAPVVYDQWSDTTNIMHK